jgi:hypothetical protein
LLDIVSSKSISDRLFWFFGPHALRNICWLRIWVMPEISEEIFSPRSERLDWNLCESGSYVTSVNIEIVIYIEMTRIARNILMIKVNHILLHLPERSVLIHEFMP